MNASPASVKSDERVVLDPDSRTDTAVFRAFVVAEARRATVDGPSVAVAPIPDHLDLYALEDAPGAPSIHYVEFESLPSGEYWCASIHDDGVYERAIFTPGSDDLRERLGVAVDDDQATLREVKE